MNSKNNPYIFIFITSFCSTLSLASADTFNNIGTIPLQGENTPTIFYDPFSKPNESPNNLDNKIYENDGDSDIQQDVIHNYKANNFVYKKDNISSSIKDGLDFKEATYNGNDVLEEEQETNQVFLTEVIEGKKVNAISEVKDFNKTALPDKQPEIIGKSVKERNSNDKSNSNKAVILMFDRGYKSQYTNGKPILDKYNFKASFFIVCDYVDDKDGMSWKDIKVLQQEGHDIQSHGVSQ